MSLESALIRKGKHLIVNACGVTDAQHTHPTVYKPFRNPVDRHVALCTNQHLTLSVKGFHNGFHKGGGLARTRRSVHHLHILCPEHFVHSMFLRGVQPRYAQGRQVIGCTPSHSRTFVPPYPRIKQIPEIGKAVAPCIDNPLQGIEHEFIGGFIEKQLNA